MEGFKLTDDVKLSTLLSNIINDAGGEKTELHCMEDAYVNLKITFRDKNSKCYDGVINGVKKIGNIYVAKKLGDIYIPRNTHDFYDFKQTLRPLYTYKKNVGNMVDMVPCALARMVWQAKASRYSLIDLPPERSAFIFTTPKNCRRVDIFEDDNE